MTVRTSTLSPSTTEAIAILWTCLHLVAHLSQKTKGKGHSICAVADCWRSPGYIISGYTRNVTETRETILSLNETRETWNPNETSETETQAVDL